jgi:hypothetical protein
LTTKDQKNAFRENHENHHPTPKDGTTDPGSYSWKLLLIKDARVHYVVLKQQPQTTHPTHQTCVIDAARKPETNKPRSHSQSRDHRSCCLRTQQCAKHKTARTPPAPFQNPHTPKGATDPYWTRKKNAAAAIC